MRVRTLESGGETHREKGFFIRYYWNMRSVGQRRPPP